MNRKILLFACLAIFALKIQAQTVTDYDGNVYHTVAIGSQIWLKENLKTTHYNNGVPIPNVPGSISWSNMTTGARCYYNNDSIAYDSVYGTLYNWYAATDINEICPSGWHVPTDAEWAAVETFLGGSFIAGGKMKEAGTVHWLPPNAGATNSSDFTGLPGGMLGTNYTFETLYENGLWWTSTTFISSSSYAWSRYFYYLNAGVDRNPTPKTIALSIRCIKDVNVGSKDMNEQKIKLYPNPSIGRVTLDCAEGQALNLWMYDLFGEIMLHRELNNKTTDMDISLLPNGIYLIRITGDTWTVQQKLIKQ
ncbi:MAG: T9SS type A sorting domain-containing protein [Bacteroidales bacterium]|nr:T9SS type A sorting domain-containing protein [Bacteroidales bacterium]